MNEATHASISASDAPAMPANSRNRHSAEAPAGAGRLNDLLVRAAGGDQRAFHHFHCLTRRSLLYRVRQSIGNAQDAEDVCQKAYLQAWRASPSFDPSLGQASTWLGRIARNLAVDHFRQRSKDHAFLPGSGDESVLAAVSSNEPEAWERLQQLQNSALLHKELARLPAEVRQVVMMSMHHGFSLRDIAGHLETPEGTIKSRMRRALLVLRASWPDFDVNVGRAVFGNS
ncbi:sigma-70 family RNA polymerase sigma factor [Paucibacter sp. R3-3]|uniref:Sigma-70 family RNA polymerase sigma factor n=1 Tax=Roseateles agri TaxID=3098619 RepID=A0ABU5DMW1_9BURK|nr:sigma-70 family RNA polymerase sigma factor [Paucibacter sp. R3-3]MDY0747649.1 sigma-70 family RNA polymerase sigma factor [Paucibacter sp. R3-3]